MEGNSTIASNQTRKTCRNRGSPKSPSPHGEHANHRYQTINDNMIQSWRTNIPPLSRRKGATPQPAFSHKTEQPRHMQATPGAQRSTQPMHTPNGTHITNHKPTNATGATPHAPHENTTKTRATTLVGFSGPKTHPHNPAIPGPLRPGGLSRAAPYKAP